MSDKKLILVVEDEEDLLDMLKEKLKMEGMDVVTALNGTDALAIAEDKKPDLILLDLVMPGKDGFAVLKELGKSEWGKLIPVILLTNLDDYESLSRALESRGHEYLVKTDWKIDDVVSRIKAKLEDGNIP